MKNLCLTALLLSFIVMFSCRREETKPDPETGSLRIDIGLSLSVREIPSALKSTPDIEDFQVRIYTSDGTEVMAFDSAEAMPDTIELEIGNYYVEAQSDNDLPAAFENPFYAGVSDVFTISSHSLQSVQVTCELGNTIVSVEYSDNVRTDFTDYSATVSSELDSLVYSGDETRRGYFRTLPLDIRVDLTYTLPGGSDTSKVLTGSIPDPLPNRHYEIRVDASIDNGMAGFQILLDSSTVIMEYIELTNQGAIGQDGVIAYGDLLITEIMPNPSALSDTEGEWFEIYNNSDREINLHGLILERDDANLHTVTDSIALAPGTFFVLQRADSATVVPNRYNYGSDILLPNTGAVLSIYNAGTETGFGALIFSVDYGSAGFPDPAGASISLDPVLTNPTDALLSSSWCVSSSAFSTGDLGTPGTANDPCQ